MIGTGSGFNSRILPHWLITNSHPELRRLVRGSLREQIAKHRFIDPKFDQGYETYTPFVHFGVMALF
jgi:hypothetical protein